MPSAAALLGPEGPLPRALPAYEVRPAQLEMADAVERALRSDRVLICEAGTGTGKTLAYLVPAILSGKKVVVSTATRALQEQIFYKDLPLIERALGLQTHAALMKGLSNYLCRRRHAEFQRSPEALRPKHARALAMVDAWVSKTQSGDLGELAGLAEDEPLLGEVSSSSDTRVGSGCAYFSECFVTGMRKSAESARLIVVNHHLFFADLSLRGPHPGRVIPDYDAVIFDEAHQLEDVATDFFGVRVSRSRVERMLRDSERALTQSGAQDALFSGAGGAGLCLAVRAASDSFWATLARFARGEDSRVVLERDAWTGELEQRYHALDSAFEGFAALLATTRGRLATRATGPAELGRIGALLDALRVGEERAEQFREQLAAVVSGGPGRVTWFDSSGTLSASPVELSHVFRNRIFESIPAVVLTSATLAATPSGASERAKAAGPFGYFRSRMGLSDAGIEVTELVVESPFDFAQNALLYTPTDLPLPNSAEFLNAALERIVQLIDLTEGGCFVLTTSLRSMRALHSALVKRLGSARVLVQGERPKTTLIGAFRAAGDAVLVATTSFWEGVDVPGRALRLVVLDKIPFLVPTDPLVRARSLALEEAGENPFMQLHVPAAAIALKQGFGRLIRTRDDIGIVTLLDRRIHQKGYGTRLLAALPPAQRANDFAAVESFWRGLNTSRLATAG